MLPTCPACGQSVLDDDASECPFCGASMSGKPGAAKPAPPPPAAKETAAEPKPKRTSKAKPADGDSPFEAAPAQSGTAIQAARKPMKGRLHRVVCPMCDTPGFVPRKAAGRDVRCANKKCMVPVFRAPAPKKAAEPEPEPAESGSPTLAIVASIVGVVVVGGVLYAMFGGQSEEKSNEKAVTKSATDTDKIAQEILDKTKKARPQNTKTGPKPLPQVRDNVLEELTDAASERNDNKPFCRRMTTEGLVAAKRFDDAMEQARLIGSPRDSKYYFRVFPFCQMAWQHLADGNTADAATAVAEAKESAARLPQFGRTEFDVKSALAAALVGIGNADEAVTLMTELAASRKLSDPLNKRAALASAQLSLLSTFEDLGTSRAGTVPVCEWSNPPWTAVGMMLCARGKTSEAVVWAGKGPTPLAQSDTLAAIAAHAAATGQAAVVDAVVAAASTPPVVARVNAAAAFGSTLGDTNRAAALLQAAKDAHGKISKPEPVVIANLRELYEYQPPRPEPFQLAAVATAEVARADAAISGGDAGATTLLEAIRYAHSFCPTPSFVQTRVREAENQPQRLRDQLAAALNLSDSAAQQAFYKLNAKLTRSLPTVLRTRSELQSSILAHLAESPLRDSVWRLVNPQTLSQSILRGELLAETPLPWRVALGYYRSGLPEEARKIADQLGTSDYPAVDAELRCHANPSAPPGDVAGTLSPRGNTDPSRLAPLLEFALNYAEQDVVKAVNYANGIRNPNWQLTTFQLVSVHTTRRGRGRQLLEVVDQLALEPPARTAIYRGFVTGVRLDPEFTTAAK